MKTRIAITALAALTLAAGASAQSLTILGQGNDPFAISDTGMVVGANGAGHWYWTADSGIVPIGGAAPFDFGGQTGVSSDGSVISGSFVNPSTGLGELGIYDVANGIWTALGSLGASSGNSAASAWGMSGDGDHIVGLGWINAGSAHAIQWSNGEGVSDLGSTVAGRSSRANAVNHDGSVVVGWQDGESGFRQGAVWVNGVQTLIFDNDGGEMGEASSVSADGQWVTGSTNGQAAWRYNTVSGGFEYIDPVLGNLFNPRAAGVAISDDGSTIVGFVSPFGPPFNRIGYIWQEGVGTTLLNDYFAAEGVNADAGYSFISPFTMSGDARTFAGWGFGNNGIEAFIVTLPGTPDCPADVDGSGSVDLADLNLVLGNFGQSTSDGDTNGDGEVDLADLNAVLGAFGTSCE
jgi:uncharacterized membrane protein